MTIMMSDDLPGPELNVTDWLMQIADKHTAAHAGRLCGLRDAAIP